MKVPATLIDRITASTVTTDGRHMALTLLDSEAHEMTLGIPSNEIPCLIENAARALSDSHRVLHTPADQQADAVATWWNIVRNGSDDGFLLTLSFGAGANIAFSLSRSMARAILATLTAHLHGAPADGDIGFVQ